MTDETLRTSAFSGSRAASLYARTPEETTVPSPVWAAMGDEFRNQVTRLVAGTLQLREGLPRDTASEFAPTLADMESSLESLAGLTKCLDAVVKPGEQVISDLGDVIERALALARPWLHSRDAHLGGGPERRGSQPQRRRRVRAGHDAGEPGALAGPGRRPPGAGS